MTIKFNKILINPYNKLGVIRIIFNKKYRNITHFHYMSLVVILNLQ